MISILPLQESDYNNILMWNQGKDADFLMQWSGQYYKYPITEEQILNRLNNTNPKLSINIFKIILEETSEIIGTIEFLIPNENPSIAFLGRFLLDEKYRGHGYGKTALSMLSNKIFADTTAEKIKLGVFLYNKSAIACYEKVGYKIDAIHKFEDIPKNDGYSMILERPTKINT